jgi:hypothetical protein
MMQTGAGLHMHAPVTILEFPVSTSGVPACISVATLLDRVACQSTLFIHIGTVRDWFVKLTSQLLFTFSLDSGE